MKILKLIDQNDQTLECWVNPKGKLYVQLMPEERKSDYEIQYITLDSEDAEHLINELRRFIAKKFIQEREQSENPF